MKLTDDTLPDDVETLQKLVLSLRSRCHYLEEQFLLARQKQFGQSSEAHPTQGDLFNEAETCLDEVVVEKETVEYSRNKPKRKPLPTDLPREVIIHDIAESDKICESCNGERHCIGESKSEQLEFIPAQIKVIEHVRPKYSCRQCEKAATQITIKQASVPTTPIPKSIATPSLLSQIITSKYQYSLPLYRQEQLFKQHGIGLNRKTMSDWMMKSAQLLEPVIQYWHKQLLQQPIIQADETTVNVLSEDKTHCYMWLYCSGADSPTDNGLANLVLYDYQPSRSGQCAVDFLRGFTGYLQADGYKGYEQTQANLVGCWAHARRKFIEAEKVQAKNKTGKANWAISHIRKLYRIEKQIKAKSAQEKYTIRQKQAKPLLKQLKVWLDKSANQVPPKSAIGQAVAYSLNQWHKLARYSEDGNLNIDNNRAERAVKPFVIGRKNWLFSNTSSGAKASATLYSVIETAKANGIIPFDYLQFLLTELPKQKGDIESLMPWKFKSIKC